MYYYQKAVLVITGFKLVLFWSPYGVLLSARSPFGTNLLDVYEFLQYVYFNVLVLDCKILYWLVAV